MPKLKELEPNAVVRGDLTERAVTVVGAQWFDANAIKFGVARQILPIMLRRLHVAGVCTI